MTMLRTCVAMMVAVTAATAVLPAAAATPARQCPAADDTGSGIGALPAVANVLKAGGNLRVLAVGSATMFGPDATLGPGTLTSQALMPAGPPQASAPTEITQQPSEKAFPRQMASALQALVPGLQVTVLVRGGRGMTAGDMLALMRTELAKDKPQLVLWQTGTVEAVRNTPPGDFAQTLAEGIEAVDQAGANVVLIDPQYSRFLQANSNLDPYVQALQQASSMPGTLLFHRFDLMRTWANAGQIDLERTPKADRQQAVNQLHACLGASLARAVVAASRQ